MTRAQIAMRLRITRSTVSELLGELLDEGTVVVAQVRPASGRGRPAELLSIDPRASRHIGVDFSHSRVAVVVTNASGDVIARGRSDYGSQLGWADRCALAIELLRSLTDGDGLHFDALQAIAIGLPGPNSASWESGETALLGEPYETIAARVREVFAAGFGVDVLVDHHIRFAALAEAHRPRTRSSRDILYLRLSNGIGGALVVAGQVAHGAHQLAGEIGHVVVRHDAAARDCRCRRRGCLETVASLGSVIGEGRRRGLEVESASELTAALAVGDPVARRLLSEVAAAVGRVLGVVAVAMDPSEIVVAGEVAELSSDFAGLVERAVAAEILPSQEVPVRLGHLGDEAGALGAAVRLAMRPGQAVGAVLSGGSSSGPRKVAHRVRA